MAENTVRLRSRAIKGRKSIYSRYVKEHIFSFGKKKERNGQNENETKLKVPLNISEFNSDIDSEVIRTADEKESPSKDDSKEDNNNHISMAERPPPFPTTRKPPCSATAVQSRTISELDSALKQFKLSTAASRESLRSSRMDLSQMEESVKTMMRSRPSTPVPERWRSRMMTL